MNKIVLANTTDKKNPIYIQSQNQSINMETGIITFTGNIVITHSTIEIYADKVIITYSNKNSNSASIIKGYGQPIKIYCFFEKNGEKIYAQSEKICYDINNNIILLTDNAYIKKINGTIKSDCISFLIKEKRIEAFSTNSRQQVVTTLLHPEIFKSK
ncbi:lipopolysaccharide transport periplasmic protein LptA [Candidatus Schneideria nysicola]|nr:lipopolysaccharide transport periplasmic protein LptA [Candidatus Schneideria nysicola]